jgi:hypothetical protein
MPFAIDCIVGQTFTNWEIEVSYRASASILALLSNTIAPTTSRRDSARVTLHGRIGQEGASRHLDGMGASTAACAVFGARCLAQRADR